MNQVMRSVPTMESDSIVEKKEPLDPDAACQHLTGSDRTLIPTNFRNKKIEVPVGVILISKIADCIQYGTIPKLAVYRICQHGDLGAKRTGDERCPSHLATSPPSRSVWDEEVINQHLNPIPKKVRAA